MNTHSKEATTTMYTFVDGPTVVIGPECFAKHDRSVLSWQGQNFIPQSVRRRRRPIVLGLIWVVSFVVLLLFNPIAAFASDAVPSGTTALGLSLWGLGVGALVPLVTYVLNRVVPSEPIRAVVLLVAATAAGALTQLVDAGSVGFDTATLRYVISAIVAALAAHHFLWKPGLVNVALGHPDHGGRAATRARA